MCIRGEAINIEGWCGGQWVEFIFKWTVGTDGGRVATCAAEGGGRVVHFGTCYGLVNKLNSYMHNVI